jgi:hypothetical protein
VVQPTPAGSQRITCVGVGVYDDALTYGNEYAVLAHDTDKQQVRVRGDNGRARWFPTYCFDMTGGPAVRLVQMTIDDELDRPTVDVVLEFSDGQRRWCYFITPERLSQLSCATQADGERLLSYRSPHMIVVSAITRAIIEQSLAYIEGQGRLLDCSLPIGD